MNQIMDAIKKRRSVRAYKDKPLPKEIIQSLLEAAMYAPTARNLQQLEYKVITDKKLIKRISERIVQEIRKEGRLSDVRDKSNPIFYDAPLVIIITGPEENKWIYSDAALAVQNIMLYATSIGLGTCFIGRARYIEKVKEIMDELKISANIRIAAAVICGYTNEEPPEKEKRMNAKFFE